jgi:hypothetical protein
MKNHALNTLETADGSQMELYVAFPEGMGNYPAVYGGGIEQLTEQ